MSSSILLGMSAAVFLASSTIDCFAGPCASEIAATERHLNDRLEAAAATAPLGPESIEALHHQQPTPRSLASALAALGVASPESAKMIGRAMRRAKQADEAGDVPACERALARIDRTIGP